MVFYGKYQICGENIKNRDERIT